MRTEAWGFKNGEDAELRTRTGHFPGIRGTLDTDARFEWHRVKILGFTADAAISVKLPNGATRRIQNPKALRKWVAPTTPEEIEASLNGRRL